MKGKITSGPTFSLSVNKINFNTVPRGQVGDTQKPPATHQALKQTGSGEEAIPQAQDAQAQPEQKLEQLEKQPQSEQLTPRGSPIEHHQLLSPPPEKDSGKRTDSFKIRNLHTHFPLDFQIGSTIPQLFQGTLTVVPEQGSILPNETQTVSVTLTYDGTPSAARTCHWFNN